MFKLLYLPWIGSNNDHFSSAKQSDYIKIYVVWLFLIIIIILA